MFSLTVSVDRYLVTKKCKGRGTFSSRTCGWQTLQKNAFFVKVQCINRKSTVSKEVSNPCTIQRFEGLRKVYSKHTYLVNVVHAGEHVKISVKFVQHSHDVHGYNFVVRTQCSKTNNVTE